MEDKEIAPPKQSPMILLLDWVGLSHQRRLSLVKFLSWFKQPSNLLSVAAILAVIIVPWIEKIVKSDEELRAKIDTLLETTNKVVAMNQQRMSSSGSDIFGSLILSAQRENELARASAIAESIRHDVYPAVLFALSNELCASGRYEEAHSYLQEVLKRGTGIHFISTRPSIDELSQAHVVNAICYAEQSQRGGEISRQDKKLADDEMSAAVALMERDDSDRIRGQLALIYVQWAEADERMGDTAQGQSHRQQAREIAKKMRFADPTVTAIVGPGAPTEPLPSPTLKEDNLPRSPRENTYIVSYPDNADEAAALVLPRPDTHGEYEAYGTLYFYHRGLFTEADDVYSLTEDKGMPGLTGIRFQKSIPSLPSTSGNVPRIQLVWTIEKMDKDRIIGVQSRVGQSPRSFIARLSVIPPTDAKSATAK